MKTNASIFCLFFTLTIFSSCKSSKELSSKDNRIEFTEIKSGLNCNYNSFTTIEIYDSKKLNTVWANLFAKYDRKPPIPTIDFEKNMLIAIALGERNSGSYSLQVESIIENKNNIKVIIDENKPGPSCITPSVMIYPFQLIKISLPKKPITYVKVLKIKDCK